MAVSITSKIRILVPVGDENVVLICRKPTAAEHSAFLKGRYEQKGRKVRDQSYDAREELMYKILVDAENAEYETAAGETKPLNSRTVLSDEDKSHWSRVLGKTVNSWIDLMPISWLSTAAMSFEEPVVGGETEKN